MQNSRLAFQTAAEIRIRIGVIEKQCYIIFGAVQMRKRPVVHTPAGKKNDQFCALVIDELHFHCFIISVPLYKCIKIIDSLSLLF